MKKLEVLYTYKKKVGARNRKFAKCLCGCGTIFESRLDAIDSGATVSCGCYNKKVITKHGLAWKDPLYKKWLAIKNRCNNPNYQHFHNYGGRGIKVCSEWVNDFSAFYSWALKNGYKEGLQIDRIDSHGNYEPSNCQFITPQENSRKTTKTKLDMETAEKIRETRLNTKLSIPQMSAVLGVSVANIKGVLYSGTWRQNG